MDQSRSRRFYLGKKSKAEEGDWDAHREYHNTLFQHERSDRSKDAYIEECKNTPLFSVEVAKKLTAELGQSPFPQYGILAKKGKIHNLEDSPVQEPPDTSEDATIEAEDGRMFLNMNAPLSVFLCGSQGSGKSHTLSCMMEVALKDSRLGKLPQPLAGLVFHYDKFSSSSHHQPCEAAYLCSTGIPVQILVPVSSARRMEKAYKALPGLPAGATKPIVSPLLLREEHLDISTMMKLMKVDTEKGGPILYMEVGHPLDQQMLE